MKKILTTCFLACITVAALQAQDSTKPSIKTVLDAKRYEFEPTNMSPLRGKTRQVTPGYSLRLKGDTLIVYLPYAGRAYSAPMGSSDGAYDFTTTSYTQTVKEGKKKSYTVSIKTTDKVYNSTFDLTVYDDGTAYLRASSTDKDAISYNGTVKEKK